MCMATTGSIPSLSYRDSSFTEIDKIVGLTRKKGLMNFRFNLRSISLGRKFYRGHPKLFGSHKRVDEV